MILRLILGHLGVMLGPIFVILEPSWAIVGAFWAILWVLGLDTDWHYLFPPVSGLQQGAISGHPGAISGAEMARDSPKMASR